MKLKTGATTGRLIGRRWEHSASELISFIGGLWCIYMVTLDGIEVMAQLAAGTTLLIAISGFAMRRTKPWLQACIASALAMIVTSLLIIQL